MLRDEFSTHDDVGSWRTNIEISPPVLAVAAQELRSIETGNS